MDKASMFDDLKHSLRILEGLAEVLLLTLIYYGGWRIFYADEGLFPAFFGNGKFVLMGVYAGLLFVVFYLCDCFKYGHHKLTDVIVSQWISIFIVDVITYFQLCLIANQMIETGPMLLILFMDVGVSFLCAYLYTAIYHHYCVPRNMLLVFGREDSLDLKFKMDTRSDKYQITQVISYDWGMEEICDAIDGHDAVIINDIPSEARNDLIKYCYGRGIRAYVAPKVSDIILTGSKEISLFDTPLRLIKGRGLTLTQRFTKRAMDIILCSLALVLFSPFMLLTALAIKIEDGGPVFYRQKRVTRNGRVFDILKFRSMIVDAEKAGEVIPATGRDPRVTKVGKVIRAVRWDESAQILNILKGDMSIVGPRPERVEHVEKYSAEIPEWHFREKVKGGLTGYAQIFGKYNTSAYDKLRFDLLYIENYSLRLDIKLMFMTLRILFSRESTEGFEKEAEKEGRRKKLISDEARDI